MEVVGAKNGFVINRPITYFEAIVRVSNVHVCLTKYAGRKPSFERTAIAMLGNYRHSLVCDRFVSRVFGDLSGDMSFDHGFNSLSL